MSASSSSLPERLVPVVPSYEPSGAASTGMNAARCGHFGACGGCSIQDIPYEEQLRRKEERVRQALASAGIAAPLVAHPSPDLWYYRNKMEFSFGDVYPVPAQGPGLLLGLKRKGRWNHVLSLRECLLFAPDAGALLEAARGWARREGLEPYNGRRHTGFLRHLVVREAKNEAGRLALLVTAPGPAPEASLAEAVGPFGITTLLRGVNFKISDTAIPDEIRTLSGSGLITETLRFPGRAVRFRVSPLSFFQTNTRGAEVLYGILRRWVEEIKPEALLDVYCGGGGISLSVSDLCGRVTGVELNASAVEDARGNAAFNGVSNAEFVSGAAEALLPGWGEGAQEAVIVDPPRSGLHPKALQALLERAPKTLIYVSCNPDALARDLKALTPSYAAAAAELVDLFPHTEHVEAAVFLKKA